MGVAYVHVGATVVIALVVYLYFGRAMRLITKAAVVGAKAAVSVGVALVCVAAAQFVSDTYL